MAIDVVARGYAAAAAKLKAAEPKVRRAAQKRVRDAARPIGQAVLIQGAKPMPKRGGLAIYLMAAGNTTTAISKDGVALRLSRKGVDLGKINAGQLRHPVYGRPGTWVGQSVPAETYDEAFLEQGKDAADDLGRVFDDIEREL